MRTILAKGGTIMKRANNFYRLFAALILIAAVLSCSKESQPLALEPETDVEDVKPELKTVSYSVSANQDGASTKVTINGNKHEFQSTDRLQITGGNDLTGPITGLLTIQEGFTAQSATFNGTLTYEGEDPSISNPELTATLISEDSQLAGIDLTKAIASDLASAVHNYGILTATSAFNTRSFSFDQKCSFINFDLYAYGFQVGETVTVILSHKESGEEQTIASNTIEVSGTDGNEKAIFTAAILGGRTITSPTITISGTTQAGTSSHNVTIKRPFGGTTVVAKKVYKVVDKAPQIGGVYYSDGTWTGNRQTEGAYALGIIVYLNNANANYPAGVEAQTFKDGVTEKQNGFGHGLVLALSDCPISSNGVKWSTEQIQIGGESDTPFEQTWFPTTTNCAKLDNNTLHSYNGIGKTAYMQANQGNNISDPVYPAAAAIKKYNDNVATITPGLNMSKWFMPTITQWMASFMGIADNDQFTPVFKTSNKSGNNCTYYPLDGVYYYDSTFYNAFTGVFDNLVNICDSEGCNYEPDDHNNGKNYNWNHYWTSTQVTSQRALCVGFRDGNDKNGNYVKGIAVSHQEKARSGNNTPMTGRQVRAFLAF